jgi:thiol-disulfide isomerase/thioredoxin
VTPGLLAAVAVLALAGGFGYWRRRRDGLLRPSRPARSGRPLRAGAAAPVGGTNALSEDELGAPLGSRATLLQFSTEVCAPCRATRRILAEVAGDVDGVAHVEVDAEARLDLVRRLSVRRTPTTFVLGRDGQVTHRVNGQPRKADVVAALSGTERVRIHGSEH